MQRSVDVSEPTLPRRSKVPRRYDIGMSFGHFPARIETVIALFTMRL